MFSIHSSSAARRMPVGIQPSAFENETLIMDMVEPRDADRELYRPATDHMARARAAGSSVFDRLPREVMSMCLESCSYLNPQRQRKDW